MLNFKNLKLRNHIEIYSIQRKQVVEYLNQNETYIPQMIESHAVKSKSHDKAYKWMATQFKNRMGFPPKNGFFWFSFNEEFLRNRIKLDDEDLLKLIIPVDEILPLLHLHRGFEYVLRGYRWNGRNNDLFEQIQPITEESTLNSWEDIFANEDDVLTDLQGVTDNIKTKWIKK